MSFNYRTTSWTATDGLDITTKQGKIEQFYSKTKEAEDSDSEDVDYCTKMLKISN